MVGKVVRHLTSKCLSFELALKAAETLQPLQVGVRTKGGLDTLIHTMNTLMGDNPQPLSDKWVLQLHSSRLRLGGCPMLLSFFYLVMRHSSAILLPVVYCAHYESFLCQLKLLIAYPFTYDNLKSTTVS